MRKKNLDLAAEMGEDVDVTEAEADAARELVPAPPAPPVAAAPLAPITLTFEQLQQLLASSKADPQSNADLVAAFTKGIENAREPIPENKFSPGISVFNVLGEKEHPRPGLKCEITLGTQDPKTKIIQQTYPFEDNDLTAQEQIALNTLEPCAGVVERLDGAKMKVSIVPTQDPVTDALTKLVIVVPADVTGKGSQIKNMLPSITNLVAQLTGHDYAKLSTDDLAWFMAEHRKKNYVAVREAVAA